ncbi:alpha-ketoglutarate-dependent dioxygenase AlkB [Aliiglaciecola litoralis]|uniref:Alpha-ketoglutarate-dependent dioxygenase AlkB n=1 Tax=Aliiglaciecola litoralis TaxID=582857 RepID=A0ABN1LE13_9ALTE
MQQDLFSSSTRTFESLPLADADVRYMSHFIDSDAAAQLYQKLSTGLAWRQDSIKLFGRQVKIPRLQAWYGDADAQYSYSGLHMTPMAWTDDLLRVKQDIEALTQCQFNSVLANWYRDGQDSMGWHSDNEPELGPYPTIASVTLGQVRDFDFKRKDNAQTYRIPLQSGSLLVMAGATQRYWQHGITKRTAPLMGRINLTFRTILASAT